MAHYAIVTLAYWAFTLTDGALRMLVLLHLHENGFSGIDLALLFVLYEAAGVVTNFTAGWIGARFGLKTTLWQGLSLQVLALGVLAWQADALTIGLVAALQGLSGIAKDLTKLGAKSYLKITVPSSRGASGLLRAVSALTGSKNALKGVGFFAGAFLLQEVGFRTANIYLLAIVAAALLLVMLGLPQRVGVSREPVRWKDLWTPDQRIRHLSVARLFLFASRDAWFAIALPLYLVDQLGWTQASTGALLAAWVVGYGVVQALAPLILARLNGTYTRQLLLVCSSLLIPLGALVAVLATQLSPGTTEFSLVALLGVFGVLFALNSALHSFLVLQYSEDDKVAMRVGFYYSANASGRLLGTLISGFAYAWGGFLLASVIASICLVVLSLCAAARLKGATEA